MTFYAMSKDRSLNAIVPIVLLFHLVLILVLLDYSTKTALPASPRKMTVSSVKLKSNPLPSSPPTQKEIASSPVKLPDPPEELKPEPKPKMEAAQEPPPKPQSKPKPKPKPEEKPKPKPVEKPKPKPTEKPKPVPEKKTPKPDSKKPVSPKQTPAQKPKESSPPEKKPLPVDEKKNNLLNQARETIGKINLKKDNTIAKAPISTSLPQRIDSLSVDQLNIESSPSMGAHEIAYRDELAARLKLLLKLPELGTVKLKLTINRKGQVIKVQILSSKSAKNSALIEKKLPELTLPPFGTQFSGMEQFTFTITMSNHD